MALALSSASASAYLAPTRLCYAPPPRPAPVRPAEEPANRTCALRDTFLGHPTCVSLPRYLGNPGPQGTGPRRPSATGAQVVGISKDSISSHAKSRTKLQLPFDLLSDPEHSVLGAYGAWGVKTMYGKTSEGTIRSTVIVDEEGRVAAVFPKVKPDGHAQDVLTVLGDLSD